MMFCTNCRNNIPDDAKFCVFCGTPVGGSAAPAQSEDQPAVEAQFQPVAEPEVQPQPQPQPQPAQASNVTANSNQGMNFDFSTNTASAPASTRRFEYKVLTQKDKWFSGKFDPMLLEQAMNAYAQQGWRVIGCATADIGSGFGAARQEFITVLEREL